MSSKTLLSRALPGVLAASMAGFAGTAAALEFQIGEETLRVENLFTIGGSWRMQDVDPTLIGKSTLYKYTTPGANDPTTGSGLCLYRTTQTAESGPSTTLGDNNYAAGVQPGACATSNAAGNLGYVNSPGSFNPNADQGNLNFDKGDMVHAVAKLLTDVNYSIWDFDIFVRGVAFFDANYTDFTEVHYDTTMQPFRTELPDSVERVVGVDYDLLDFNIGRFFTIFDHDFQLKLGNQVLNWGESSLLALNSLNTINPPDARRLNIPGLDLKEVFRPIGMATVRTDLFEFVSVEAFYAYDWKPAVIDPVGSFFSQSDTLGDGGDFAMLSFGKAPEDPGFAVNDPRYPAGKRGYYRPIDTCDGATCADTLGLLGSTASRTVFRDHAEEDRREPDGGDYGAAFRMFFEDFNNGTEAALYFANYDSRLPVASAIAALDSCIGDDGAASALTFAADCGYNGPMVAADNEPIPVDTARLIIEYPQDIRLYGMSFNTTIGDYALSGEYAFRENLPVQIDTVDLTYTALQPAFPDQDVNLGAAVIPGKQSAFPSFLTRYRGLSCAPGEPCINAGQYIPGFERFKVGQANLTLLRLIGGDNPIGASQMTFLFETGMQKVFDLPALSELQLEGSGSDTHISNGADGSTGIEPPMVAGNLRANTTRQNPTAQTDYVAYGTSESYGYRLLNLNRWDSALFGINLETLVIVRHDVKGTSPGIGTNFLDGRKQFNFGLRGDYLSAWSGEVRYTWFTGGGRRDAQRDRDNIFVMLGYQF